MNLLYLSSNSPSSPLSACRLWGFQHPSTLLLQHSQNVTWLVSSAIRHRSVWHWLTFFSMPLGVVSTCCCVSDPNLSKPHLSFHCELAQQLLRHSLSGAGCCCNSSDQRTLCLIKSEWGLVAEEERAVTLIHEHYPLFFSHPFSIKVDARPLSNIFMRTTCTPLLPRVFIPAAASRDEKGPALLGQEASSWKQFVPVEHIERAQPGNGYPKSSQVPPTAVQPPVPGAREL